MFSHITEFPSRRVYKFKTVQERDKFAELFNGFALNGRTLSGKYIVLL